jgi:hypothetical protein
MAPLCQEAVLRGVVGRVLPGSESGLSEESAWGCEPVAVGSVVVPRCPHGPATRDTNHRRSHDAATAVTPTRREPELLGQTVVVIAVSDSKQPDGHAPREPTSSSPRATPSAYNTPRWNSARGAARPSTPPISLASSSSSRSCRTDRPCDGHSRRPVLRASGQHELRAGAPRRRRASVADTPRRSQCRRQGATGGTLLFISGTGGRRPAVGLSIVSTPTAALPALTKSLALELGPVRVNLIAPWL